MSRVHRAVSVSLKRTREQKLKAANNRVYAYTTDSQQPQLKRKTVATVVQQSSDS